MRADDDVVARAKQGDPEAWRVLYREHAGRLVAWLGTRPTGDAAASPEDVAGEAWTVAASKVADFHGTTDDFGGWLFGIARRVGANARRTHERRGTRPGDVDDHTEATTDPTLDVVRQEWLRGLLATLPPRERDAVGLVDGLGMEPRHAAEVLGISSVALRVARHRGLRRLGGSPSHAGIEVLREGVPGT